MGTFHNDKGELHGITVVVDTSGPRVFIGRCDTLDDEKIILVGVAEHTDGDKGQSKEEFVKKSAKLGFWEHHSRIELPTSEIASITRLGEVRAS